MRQFSYQDFCICYVKELGFFFWVKGGVKCKLGSVFFGGGQMLSWRMWVKLGVGKLDKRFLGKWMRK